MELGSFSFDNNHPVRLLCIAWDSDIHCILNFDSYIRLIFLIKLTNNKKIKYNKILYHSLKKIHSPYFVDRTDWHILPKLTENNRAFSMFIFDNPI